MSSKSRNRSRQSGAELAGQHPVHGAGRQRRRRLLQPGERLAVGAGEVLGQGRLEDRHGLAELHRPALELAEHLEQLLGGARLHLGGDDLGRPAARCGGRARGWPARRSPAAGPASLTVRAAARRGRSSTVGHCVLRPLAAAGDRPVRSARSLQAAAPRAAAGRVHGPATGAAPGRRPGRSPACRRRPAAPGRRRGRRAPAARRARPPRWPAPSRRPRRAAGPPR